MEVWSNSLPDQAGGTQDERGPPQQLLSLRPRCKTTGERRERERKISIYHYRGLCYHEDLLEVTLFHSQDLVLPRVQSSHSVDLAELEYHERLFGLKRILIIVHRQLLVGERHHHELRRGGDYITMTSSLNYSQTNFLLTTSLHPCLRGLWPFGICSRQVTLSTTAAHRKTCNKWTCYTCAIITQKEPQTKSRPTSWRGEGKCKGLPMLCSSLL